MNQENHIVMGLGGTGSAVVRELKKLLFLEWRTRNSGENGISDTPPTIYEFEDRIGSEEWSTRIATINIDSNKTELEGQADKWLIMGEQLRLEDTEKVLLEKTGLSRILENMSNYPGVRPWVEKDIDLVTEITRGSEKAEGCDQIRRLGRLAIADRGNISKIRDSFNGQKNRLTAGGNNNVTIHLCATLGCGTGSGIMLDLIAQLRKALKTQAGEYPIYLYVFLTGDDIPNDPGGKFHTNQYGALEELNAMRLGLYEPWDISAEASSERLTVNDAFSSCFLISNVAEGGQTLSLEEQVNSASEFLFQKFVRLLGNIPKELDRSHTFEDVRDIPTDSPDSDRSTRFASFGIKRLAIPDQEIQEKLAFTFERQALLSLIYGNWDSQIGYVDASMSFDADKFVSDEKQSWGIGARHLTLDSAPGEEQYKKIWEGEIVQLADEIKMTYGDSRSREWASQLQLIIEPFWKKGFRGRGVDAYFSAREGDNELANRARSIASEVERSLLEGWLAGKDQFVSHNFPKILAKTKAHLQETHKEIKNKLKTLPEEAKKQGSLRAKNEDELADVGVISRKFGKHHEIYQAYCRATINYYTARSLERAMGYADKLIGKLIPEINAIRTRVLQLDTNLKKLEAQMQSEIDARVKKTEDENKENENQQIDYINVAEIEESIRALRLEKSTQDMHVEAQRKMLDIARGQRRDFGVYLEKLHFSEETNKVGGVLLDKFHREGLESSLKAHDAKDMDQDDHKFRPILNQNIVKKLAADYGGAVTSELEGRFRSLMARAMPSLSFDRAAEPVEKASKAPIHRCSVFLPQCSELGDSTFRQELAKRIKLMTGDYEREIEIFDVPETRNTTEIVFLSTAAFFPLRMAQPVVALKERYEKKVSADKRRVEFLSFGENHTPRLPDLMKPSDRMVRQQTLPYFCLALVTDLVHIPEGDEYEDIEIIIGEMDNFGRAIDKIGTRILCTPADRREVANSEARYGMKIPIELTCALSRYEAKFDVKSANKLKTLVSAKITQAFPGKSSRQPLKERLGNIAGMAFVAQGKKEDDITYALFDEAAREAGNLLDILS